MCTVSARKRNLKMFNLNVKFVFRRSCVQKINTYSVSPPLSLSLALVWYDNNKMVNKLYAPRVKCVSKWRLHYGFASLSQSDCESMYKRLYIVRIRIIYNACRFYRLSIYTTYQLRAHLKMSCGFARLIVRIIQNK